MLPRKNFENLRAVMHARIYGGGGPPPEISKIFKFLLVCKYHK